MSTAIRPGLVCQTDLMSTLRIMLTAQPRRIRRIVFPGSKLLLSHWKGTRFNLPLFFRIDQAVDAIINRGGQLNEARLGSGRGLDH